MVSAYQKISPEIPIISSICVLTTCTFADHARIDRRSLSSIKESGLIPLSSPALKPSAPSILRRKRKLSEQENVQHYVAQPEATVPVIEKTPTKTPVKSLPFSPSQVRIHIYCASLKTGVLNFIRPSFNTMTYRI